MARRMIDPQAIIKSQIVDDKQQVDLNEILEKYGTQDDWAKSVTLQFYSKETYDDIGLVISSDITSLAGCIIPNGAITITKINDDNDVYISGLIIDDSTTMNLLRYIHINAGDYENGIMVSNTYEFDIHVIKV